MAHHAADLHPEWYTFEIIDRLKAIDDHSTVESRNRRRAGTNDVITQQELLILYHLQEAAIVWARATGTVENELESRSVIFRKGCALISPQELIRQYRKAHPNFGARVLTFKVERETT